VAIFWSSGRSIPEQSFIEFAANASVLKQQPFADTHQ